MNGFGPHFVATSGPSLLNLDILLYYNNITKSKNTNLSYTLNGKNTTQKKSSSEELALLVFFSGFSNNINQQNTTIWLLLYFFGN